MARALPLETYPVHLGTGATALPQEAFTGMDWYARYEQRHRDDGPDGRLVALHRFSGNWSSWEMHPLGDEVVICIEGAMTVIQELGDGTHLNLVLSAGEVAINPAGIWHTADIAGKAAAIFITPGFGTQNRGREVAGT